MSPAHVRRHRAPARAAATVPPLPQPLTPVMDAEVGWGVGGGGGGGRVAGRQEGWTPLHLAARHGRAEAVAALLRGGADVNAAGPVSPARPGSLIRPDPARYFDPA